MDNKTRIETNMCNKKIDLTLKSVKERNQKIVFEKSVCFYKEYPRMMNHSK